MKNKIYFSLHSCPLASYTCFWSLSGVILSAEAENFTSISVRQRKTQKPRIKINILSAIFVSWRRLIWGIGL